MRRNGGVNAGLPCAQLGLNGIIPEQVSSPFSCMSWRHLVVQSAQRSRELVPPHIRRLNMTLSPRFAIAATGLAIAIMVSATTASFAAPNSSPGERWQRGRNYVHTAPRYYDYAPDGTAPVARQRQ